MTKEDTLPFIAPQDVDKLFRTRNDKIFVLEQIDMTLSVANRCRFKELNGDREICVKQNGCFYMNEQECPYDMVAEVVETCGFYTVIRENKPGQERTKVGPKSIVIDKQDIEKSCFGLF